MKTIVFFSMMAAITALFMLGCTLTTTVVTEDDYDVRVVNQSGQKVKMRWGEDSYRYLDAGETVYIPAKAGSYELEFEDGSSRSHTRPNQVFKIEVKADIQITVHEDPDSGTIIIEM